MVSEKTSPPTDKLTNYLTQRIHESLVFLNENKIDNNKT